MNGFEPRLIELAGDINSQMPAFMLSRVADALNEPQKSLKGSRILAVGVAYKRDVSDTRESPALEVLQKLHEKGALVEYCDPYVPAVELDGRVFRSVELTPASVPPPHRAYQRRYRPSRTANGPAHGPSLALIPSARRGERSWGTNVPHP